MKNILVVNVNWIGDVILSTPVFKALKKAYPGAKVSCLAVPRVKEILESCPYVDEIILYDEEKQHGTFLGKIRLIVELRKRRFEIAFLLHRSLTRALLVFLAGIPQRVGYDTKKRGFLLTHKVKPLPDGVHRGDHYLNVIESFGVHVDDRDYALSVSAQSRDDMDQRLRREGITPTDEVMAVNIGGNWDLKRWPKENYIQLIDRLTDEFKVKVVLPGAQKDLAMAQEINHKVKNPVVVFAGKTDIKQLLALMKRVNLVISADSGPMHLANSVGATTIGLFGPTRAEVTGPRGQGKTLILQKDIGCNQHPCYHLECPDNLCMKMITVNDVIEAIKKIRR